MKRVTDYLEKYYKDTNYNCAEAVFSAAMEAWELDMPKEMVKTMAGFGAGMGSGSVCGAVTGGVAALGCRFVEGDGGHTSPRLMQLVRAYQKLVKEKFGSTECRDLRPKFYSQEERCFHTIRNLAEALDEVVCQAEGAE